MIDGVVGNPVPHPERRLLKSGRAGPFETHAAVTRDVDDQIPGGEQLELLVGHEHHRAVGVLHDAVHDDVKVRQVLGDRGVAHLDMTIVPVHMLHRHGRNR